MLPIVLLSLFGVGVLSTTSIPECATSCVSEAIDASSCSSVDTKCICSSDAFKPSLDSCIKSSCDEEESQQDAMAHADQFCAALEPHGSLRAREAQPEAHAQPHPQGYGQHKPPHHKPPHHKKCQHHKYPYWSSSHKKCVQKCKPGYYVKNKACHPKRSTHHHKKCHKSPHPYYHPTTKNCVKHCPPHHYLENKECHPEHPHHHPNCKHSPHPYWSYPHKKCVKHCKPGDYMKHKECHPHKHTTMHTTHTHTAPHYPTPTYHTPTPTPTVY